MGAKNAITKPESYHEPDSCHNCKHCFMLWHDWHEELFAYCTKNLSPRPPMETTEREAWEDALDINAEYSTEIESYGICDEWEAKP